MKNTMTRKRVLSEEEKERNRKRAKEWYWKNKDKAIERIKEWSKENSKHRSEYLKKYKETHKEEIKEWYKSKKGRASYLLQNYKREDRKYNRGECDLTVEWIINNIFSMNCVHCGESDWRNIGCNRLDNSKPHTKDNVEPCCYKCNCKIH